MTISISSTKENMDWQTDKGHEKGIMRKQETRIKDIKKTNHFVVFCYIIHGEADKMMN